MTINKVLVCDDSSPDRVNLQRIVSGTGCVVLTASNGKEALEKARTEQPDLIFLDIIMPEMDGFETCRLLNSDPQTSAIPVVFVTSKRQQADRVWATMQGGRDLVSKPYEDSQIMAQLERTE